VVAGKGLMGARRRLWKLILDLMNLSTLTGLMRQRASGLHLKNIRLPFLDIPGASTFSIEL
jgi:hypothetical protein